MGVEEVEMSEGWRGRAPGYRVLVAFLGAVAISCASGSGHQQARTALRTSFLGNYAELQAGAEGQALLRYVDPAADFTRYDKIAMDPVLVWAKEGSNLADLPVEEIQSLVDQLDASLRERLGRDYQLVDRAGPGVMRLRVAITEADGAPSVMGTVSAWGPGARMLAGARTLATGTASFVDRAGVEAEILDSLTNRRLAAAIDRRVVQTTAESWEEIHRIFDFWADRLAGRLSEARSGSQNRE